MPQNRIAGIAEPTIAEVVAEFLADQRKRVGAGTFRNYQGIVDLFQRCLDRYAYEGLGKVERKLFERLYEAEGDAHREFCQIFGPERILPHVNYFLTFFIIRKVIAPQGMIRAAGTVMKRLAAWLAEKGYVKADEARDAKDQGAAAARDLPRAEKLATLLQTFADMQPRGDEDSEIEDHFAITRVEPGKIWLDAMGESRRAKSIEVPELIGRLCTVGWSISGVIGRVGGKWRLVEAWNVYPSGT
jgi:hypothetical protein